MYHHLKSYLGENDILFKSQYGFRENHSTQHAIIDIVNVIQNNMDQKLLTCGIFLDLKKAFDTVDHLILLQNLIIMASEELSMTGLPRTFSVVHK